MARFLRFPKLLIALGLALLLFAAVGLAVAVWPENETSSALALARPPFLTSAEASASESEDFDVGAKLDAEAGISAYFKVEGPVDLALVKTALRTVELEGTDYIIGSVDIPDYPEDYDAHIYVHEDGWFMAYYLNTDLPAKIIDTNAHTIQTTIFKTALSTVAGAAGVSFSGETYYDFRYPDATTILLVAEDQSDGDCFNITLPAEYEYYSRTWAQYDNYYQDFFLDDVQLVATYTNATYALAFGSISSTQLQTGVSHTICVSANGDSYGVLMVFYRIP